MRPLSGWRRLTGKTADEAVPPSLEQTAWQRACRKFPDACTGDLRVQLWIVAWTLAGTGVGVYYSVGHARTAQAVITVVCLMVGTLIALGTTLGALWVTAPAYQRDEARSLLAERKALEDLVELERQLRAVYESNERNLADVRKRGLTGALERDEVPWIKSENVNMERWLPGAGFSELIPTLVLSNPSFATWDEVQRVAEEFGRNIDGVLNSDLFSKVRHLDGLRFAQADEKRKLAGASKQLGTELRDIRHKIEVVMSMRPHPHYSQHFRLPAARWDEYDALLATAEPSLYPLVEAAYTAAHRVNEHLGFRRTRAGDPTKTLGAIKDDGLDAAYEAAGEALDALEEPRGEVWESGVDRDVRTVTEDVVREGVQRGLDSEKDPGDSD